MKCKVLACTKVPKISEQMGLSKDLGPATRKCVSISVLFVAVIKILF